MMSLLLWPIRCHILVAPFDITIGKCAVIQDPFGTRLCILDLTKGLRPLNLTGSIPTKSEGMS
jgi:hypothetical protein